MKEQAHRSIKASIIEKCLLLERIGYFVGTWGNVSVRVPEGLIVTPSRVAYNLITVDDFVTLSLDGRVLSGHRVPTSEAEIHRGLMNERKDIGAIIHSHSPYATAIACLRQPIPAFVEDLAQIVGGQVNCTDYVPGGQHRPLADEVVSRIGAASAVLLANHGPVCCGRDLDEAFVVCQIVEKAAMMMLAAASAGKVIPIPEEHVRAERHRYLYRYGTREDAE